MPDPHELNPGDEITVVGRPADGDSQSATVIEAGNIMLRTPQHGPRTRGTQYSNAALVKLEDGRHAVVNASDIER